MKNVIFCRLHGKTYKCAKFQHFMTLKSGETYVSMCDTNHTLYGIIVTGMLKHELTISPINSYTTWLASLSKFRVKYVTGTVLKLLKYLVTRIVLYLRGVERDNLLISVIEL